MEFKSITLVDLKLFYVKLLIVVIGINDIENTTARHNAVIFSLYEDNKTFFFTKQVRKKNEDSSSNLHQLGIITKGAEKAGKKCFLHKLELYYDAWYHSLKHMS